MAQKDSLFNPKPGRSYLLGGFKPDKVSPTLPKFGSAQNSQNKNLPSAVDLRKYMTPIEEQGDNNHTCVGNALAGACEYLIQKNLEKHVDVSRLFIYYNARRKGGSEESNMRDDGCAITHAIAALVNFGCCKEDLYPFDLNKINQKPLKHCYVEAKKFRVIEAASLSTKLSEMKACIADGYPFAFGSKIFQSFLAAETNGGYVIKPDHNIEVQNEEHGWHAMLTVGYNDRLQCFLVRNSWGKNWDMCLDLHTIKSITD